MPERKPRLYKRRPAETAAGLGWGIVTLVVRVFEVDDPQTIAALYAIVAALPAAVSTAVDHWRRWKAGT